jgi:DNA-binding CsgD family transcriptional regulator
MSNLDRALCAEQFLGNFLTSRERMLLAAFALGYNQLQVAHAWGVSPPAVNQMCRRIERKATQYWKN